jgi:SRSO17 transposase
VILRTRDLSRVSEQYFKGLIQASKNNIERMAEAVPDCDDQSLQRFLTNSPWEDQRVVEQITHDANSLLGGHVGSCLIIDESGMPKKGKNSVNVSKQWCGQLGKTDNYQVGVYSSLCRCEYAVPIGYRLFLPQCWIDAKGRYSRRVYRVSKQTWACRTIGN